MAKISKKFPALYGRAGNGAIHKWLVWTEGPWIVTEFGHDGGKRQTTKKKAKGKSIGRSNETTASEQAILEAKSMWNRKVDKGYTKNKSLAKTAEVFLPMLAKKFDSHKSNVCYPCSVQPKLDGLRCMAYWDRGKLKLMSRRGKTYNLPHVIKELEKILPKNLVLDGELYLHGESFQTITSWVKRLQNETENVEYHVYDAFLRDKVDMPYKDRFELLYNWYSEVSPESIVIVDTYDVDTEEEIHELQIQFCADGFEGAIVRNHEGIYKLKHRSADLLKVKSFQDDEFEVIDWKRGQGRFHECAIWRCVNENGSEFEVVCKGTMEQRKEQLDNADGYIGQWLKVRFFELTDDGVPRFPVGLGFRLLEDM